MIGKLKYCLWLFFGVFVIVWIVPVGVVGTAEQFGFVITRKLSLVICLFVAVVVVVSMSKKVDSIFKRVKGNMVLSGYFVSSVSFSNYLTRTYNYALKNNNEYLLELFDDSTTKVIISDDSIMTLEFDDVQVNNLIVNEKSERKLNVPDDIDNLTDIEKINMYFDVYTIEFTPKKAELVLLILTEIHFKKMVFKDSKLYIIFDCNFPSFFEMKESSQELYESICRIKEMIFDINIPDDFESSNIKH